MKFNKGIIFGIQLYLLKTNTYWVRANCDVLKRLHLANYKECRK